jgi:hypothetical protein
VGLVTKQPSSLPLRLLDDTFDDLSRYLHDSMESLQSQLSLHLGDGCDL